MQVTKM